LLSDENQIDLNICILFQSTLVMAYLSRPAAKVREILKQAAFFITGF